MKLDAELISMTPPSLDHNNNNNSNLSSNSQSSNRSFSNSGSSVSDDSELSSSDSSKASTPMNSSGAIVVDALNIDKLSFNCTASGEDRLLSSSSSASWSADSAESQQHSNHAQELLAEQQQQQKQKQQYTTLTSLKCHSLYKIQEKIRSGGFGDVFKGVRKLDLTPIAIKIIRKDKINSWTLNVYIYIYFFLFK